MFYKNKFVLQRAEKRHFILVGLCEMTKKRSKKANICNMSRKYIYISNKNGFLLELKRQIQYNI